MTIPAPQPPLPQTDTPATVEGASGIGAVLDTETQAQVTRLLRRTLGRKFAMVVVEARAPSQRRTVVEWVRGLADQVSGQLLEVNLQRLPHRNLWRELRELVALERLDTTPFVLAVSGLETEVHREPPGPPEQLNIQRDLFVRDLPGFWLLFLHPTGVMNLRMRAPDFCDFVSLWVETREKPEAVTAPSYLPETANFSVFQSSEDEDFLDQARSAALNWRFDESRDLLARHRLLYGADSDPREDWVLGVIAMREGRYEDAAALLKATLQRQEEEQPTKPLYVARALSDLCELNWLEDQGLEARKLCERALKIREVILPPNHPDIASTLNDLAVIQRSLGESLDAERIYRQALSIRTSVLPAGHPDIANSLTNLASLYLDEGKLQEAESLFVEAVSLYRVSLPKEHPELAQALNNLACLYLRQRKFSEAKHLNLEALMIRRASLPFEHPDIAASLYNLGVISKLEGNFRKAEHLFDEALKILLTALSPEHSRIALVKRSLERLRAWRGERPLPSRNKHTSRE